MIRLSKRGINYFLIGQPGSGKSTLGAKLAKKLNYSFIDADRDILEPDFGITVTQAVEKFGDDFLAEEARATRDFISKKLNVDTNSVVALSGSNVMDNSEVVGMIQDLGEVVYLDFPHEDLTNRICSRPTGHAEIIGFDLEKPSEFYETREDYYLNSFTKRIKFPTNQNIDESVDYLEEKLTNSDPLFVSTRTENENYRFYSVALSGLAPDGGLYLPKPSRAISRKINLDRLVELDFMERNIRILEDLLPAEEFPPNHIEKIVFDAYKHFPESGSPIVTLDDNLAIAELFHGPSGSFKDFALQLFPYILRSCQTGDVIPPTLILAATSGDTGGALLSGLDNANLDGMYGIVLMPADGTSEIQKRQMLSFNSNPNISVLQIDSDFDYCQKLVKRMLTENTNYFAAELFMLLSVANSISWPRLVAQTAMHSNVYLESVKQGFCEFGEKVDYCIPTGNFGSIFSAYWARQASVPFNELILATNENRVLVDVFETGEYSVNDRVLTKTKSCAMDILTASNFERLIFHLFGATRTNELYHLFNTTGKFVLTSDELQILQSQKISAVEIQGKLGAENITLVENNDYRMCPHTAIGYSALQNKSGKKILAATAHPDKFEKSDSNISRPQTHPWLAKLEHTNEGQIFPADYDVISNYIIDFGWERKAVA